VTESDPVGIYQGLRLQVLQSSRESLGIAPTDTENKVWGVVMDWNLGHGTATVIAVADGNASVYLSSGGGSIGGGKTHESIRLAAQKAVLLASELLPKMRHLTEYPLPEVELVSFYALTDTGVFSESASTKELAADQHPLSSLGNAMQEIIMQYQMIQG
jgi:hypothetical protein